MDKFNCNGGENILKSICWLLSYLSWLLVAVNNLASLRFMYMYEPNQIWNIHVNLNTFSEIFEVLQKMNEDDSEVNSWRKLATSSKDSKENELADYIPIQMEEILTYIVYNIWIIISIIGCVVFAIKTIFKKEQTVIDGMMGKFSQFHFFPLMCAFILTLLGEIFDSTNSYDVTNCGLVFSLLGVGSMIFIYIMTDFITNDWWAEYSLKKGTFSCLIILFWYNFCYSIFWVRFFTDPSKATQDFAKGCGIAFSLLFGIGSLAFSIVFKDIMICFMNILIYIGMIKYYFYYPVQYRSKTDYNENGDGAIDLIILICSIIWFLYLIIEIIKNQLIKLSQQIITINQVQTLAIAKINTNSANINLLANKLDPSLNPNPKPNPNTVQDVQQSEKK